jgi:hypothetical protein
MLIFKKERDSPSFFENRSKKEGKDEKCVDNR